MEYTTATEMAPETNSSGSSSSNNSSYDVKWVSWHGHETAIIMQNKNGPCPLIALFNVLLLSKRVCTLQLFIRGDSDFNF